MKKLILLVLLFIGQQAIAMQNPDKNQLMDLIAKSDLTGVRSFTQNGGTLFIDEEAITAAKNKFETIHNPREAQSAAAFCMSNEFCIMVILKALAPKEVKTKMGLPTLNNNLLVNNFS